MPSRSDKDGKSRRGISDAAAAAAAGCFLLFRLPTDRLTRIDDRFSSSTLDLAPAVDRREGIQTGLGTGAC